MEEVSRDCIVETISTRVIVVIHDQDREILLTHEDIEPDEDAEFPITTLGEIERKMIQDYGKDIVIYVWFEIGVRGTIYQWGNHGEYWEEHGETKGYA